MPIMTTNFAWKHEYDVKLWRHKMRTPNANDHHMPLNETLHENFLRTPLARFTVLVSCSGELAVHSWPFLCPQGQLVAKLASGLFYCWSLLLCDNNMATNLLFTASYDIRLLAACDRWTHILADNAVRQWLLIAVSRDAGEWWHWPPDLSKEGQRGQKCLFHNNTIGNFMVDQDRIEIHFL